MENNISVPVKTKVAAWMLIGLGIYFAAAFLYSLFVGFQIPEFKTEVIPVATGIGFVAFIIGVLAFLAGLPLFDKQKKRILIHASIVFLAAYVTLFTFWQGIISFIQAIFYSIGCKISFDLDAPACVANSDAFNDSLNTLFYSTAGLIFFSFLVFVLTVSGLKLMKLNRNWWIVVIVLMAVNVLSMGNIALTINLFLHLASDILPSTDIMVFLAEYDIYPPISQDMFVSIGFSLAVIILLLLDRKQFFSPKKPE